MGKRGVSWVDHYIDDFITIGPPNSEQCQHNMLVMHEVCERLGLPVEPEGPAMILAFLGIELDSSARAGRTGPVGQAKTGPLFSANSVMIVAFINAICMNVVMIVTISM